MPATAERPAIAEPTQKWWRPGRSMQEFHASNDRVRWLIGGRGSAKTASGTMEVVRHAWHSAGTKTLALRKTEISQTDTTTKTFHSVCRNLGTFYEETDASLFRTWRDGLTIRLPSQKAVDAYNAAKPTFANRGEEIEWVNTIGDKLCGYVEFRGLPDARQSEGRLRGAEASLIWLIEADLLEEADFQMAVACLRWKGTDPETCDRNGFILDTQIIVDTNPPSPRHWIAKIEEEWKRGERDGHHFWHIKTEENAHNLPPGYVEELKRTYRNNPAMYRRMVLGDYAEAFDGSPVYYGFSEENTGEDLPWPKGAYLIASLDFGTQNATIFSAYWRDGEDEYWHCMAEQYLEGSDTERQARGIQSMLEAEFPFWNERETCSGILYFCDPSGNASNFSTKETGSSVKILNTYGIHPGTLMWNRGIAVGTAIGNRMMEKRDRHGAPIFKVDTKNCPILYRALSGGYRYPNAGEAGYGKDEPLKGLASQDFDYSHIADSLRYGFMNCMKLLQTEHEKAKRPAFAGQRKKNPNPNKK